MTAPLDPQATPQGKLIVIDGTDGSGKTEQWLRAVTRSLKEGYAAGGVDFPRYGTPTGKEVLAMLRGKYGDAAEL
ncbi:MAG: hypothetical protein RLZZ324_358, partial [Candidatus Parcubacteria bacterium]